VSRTLGTPWPGERQPFISPTSCGRIDTVDEWTWASISQNDELALCRDYEIAPWGTAAVGRCSTASILPSSRRRRRWAVRLHR